MHRYVQILISLLSVAVVLLGGLQISDLYSNLIKTQQLIGESNMLNSIFDSALKAKSVTLNSVEKIDPNCIDSNEKKCEVKTQSITLILKDDTRGKN